MRLFLLEYATCCEELDADIAVEGLAMFKSLYTGFKSFFEINSFVRDEFKDLFNLPTGSFEDIESFVENSDCFLVVAPEDDDILYNITKTCEKYSYNLGSSSKAIEVVADKWKLYKKLKGKVNVPKTSKKPLGDLFIVKPRKSCGGNGIRFSNELPKGFIAQEYINGLNLSVSLIVKDEIVPISINEQILDGFKYRGAIIPARVDENMKEEVFNEAIEAVERIKGLKGYVGVDVVYSDIPYVIEINSRITTPSIAFEYVYGVNVAELIYRLHFDEIELPKNFRRHILLKEDKAIKNSFVTLGNYSITVKEYDDFNSPSSLQ